VKTGWRHFIISRLVSLLRNTRKTECGAKFLSLLAVRAAPFALLNNRRKMERGAKFLSLLPVRAAALALLSLLAAVTFAQTTPPLALPVAPNYYDYANNVNPTGKLVVGEFNTLQFLLSGGTSPYTVSVTNGQLPAGLALINLGNSTNVAGVSTAAGTFTFTLTATDSSTPPQTATQSYTVAAAVNPFTIGGSLVGAVVNVPYGTGSGLPPIYARGGLPPYHWTLLQGVVPPGMSFAGATPGFGSGAPTPEISGTPSKPGTFSFELQVTDSSPTPLTLTQTYSLSVINLTPFTDPNSGQPTGIVVGPDQNLWFTQQAEVGSDNLHNPIFGLESVSTAGSFNNETKLTTQVPSSSGSLANPVPQSITAGPDGSFWMTDNTNSAIVAAKSGAPGSVISVHTASGTYLSPTGIASGGSEGGVWFSAVQGSLPGTGIIGRIDPASQGSPTLYTIPQASSYPTGIVQNPKDGNAIWFMDQFGPAFPSSADAVVIGRIPVPVNSGSPFQLPAGCQASNAKLGITLDECVIPGTQGHVLGSLFGQAPVGPLMQADSSGTVWFASRDQVGSISADGSKVQLSTIQLPNASTTWRITSLTLGSDGAVWYVGSDPSSDLAIIGRVATSGTNSTITQFRIPAGTLDPNHPTPSSITTGPDGALWFTDAVEVHGKVVQVFPSLALNCSIPSTLYLNVPIPSNAQCSALGGKAPYTYTFNAAKAPPGVAISASGVLSGTPTAPGSFNIQVSDSSSPVQQANQVISIQAAPAIQLSCSFPSTGTAGQPYSGSCIAANGNPPYTYTTSPSNALPALGLTGVATAPTGSNSSYSFSVSGNLSLSAHGTVTFTITAADSATPVPNTSAPQTITIAITSLAVSLSCSQSAQAIVGQPFQQQCFGSAGAPPYTFSATGLPSGLSMNGSSGIISGIATSPGEASVSVMVTDSASQTATQTINFSVVNPKLSLPCVFPATATVGAAYTAACAASGGVGPYSYSIVTGTLPAGLTLNPTSGIVSGTPTSLGSAFSVQVTDSESPAATARFSENLFVQPAVLTILSTSLPVPNPGLLYAAIPLVRGGTPPYTFAISSGALPGGLQLAPDSGVISSTCSLYFCAVLATGPYNFTIQVTDSVGATATQAYSGTILAALQPEIISVALPSASGANGITAGPDGALWFTTLDQAGGNLIGRIATDGTIASVISANALTQFNSPELPTGGDITLGPDGNLWIAQRDGNVAGGITTGGAQFTYVPSTPNSSPAQITAGTDGTLWFTEAAASKIGHVGPGGSVVEFPTPTPGAFPLGIAGSGIQSFMVFTETLVNKIGFISTDGKTSGDFTIPTANALPTSIVLGSDNAFWFTEYGSNKIGRMDFSGNFQEFPVSSAPTAITAGPDGALYFTETAGNAIGRITIAGAVTEFAVPDVNSGPTGIVAGPDGALWFTEDAASRIGRLSFVVGPTVSCTLPSSPQKAGSSFSGTCSATQGTPPYTWSGSGNPPPGLTINPNSGAISGTLTTAGTFTFNVVVTDSSTPPLTGQQSYTFVVSPLPLGLVCNPPTAYLYTAYAASSYGCSATNGTPPYTYTLTSGTLPAGLSVQTGTANIAGTPASLGSFPISVEVTDSSAATASATSTIQVQYGTITSTGGPLFTLSTPPISVDPGGTVPGLTLSANESLRATVTGTVTLAFTDSNLLLNTTAGYVDPAMQFQTGGTTYHFTIPSGSSSVTLPAFDVGTVAGSIQIAITADGLAQTQTGGRVIVPPATPVIEPGSVQFTNVTSAGFDLEFLGMSATRSITAVTITLNPASGDQIVGQSTFTLDVTKVMDAWFSSPASSPYGGSFSFTIPLEVSGDAQAIASATVIISATAGNPSQPVTGSR
jgi:streptogramin lyase